MEGLVRRLGRTTDGLVHRIAPATGDATGRPGMRPVASLGRPRPGLARVSSVLLALALLSAALPLAAPARAQEPLATGPIVIEGVALRQVLDSPVPL